MKKYSQLYDKNCTSVICNMVYHCSQYKDLIIRYLQTDVIGEDILRF